MKHTIITFFQDLVVYDYVLFGVIFLLFILLIILGILVRKKTALSIFIVLFSFSFLFIAPVVGYIKMHEYLYKNSSILISQKKLTFTQAVVIYAKVTNLSKRDFKLCKITIGAYKVNGNSFKDYIFKFNPFQKMSIIESNISKGQTRMFKTILDPFTYSDDYNISIGANCR